MSLNSFIDQSGIIIVGRRLNYSHYKFEKHPVVLWATHPLPQLLAEYENIKLLDADTQLQGLPRDAFGLFQEEI